MLENSGITVEQDDNCTNIVYKLYQITSTDVKKFKIEVSHRTENGNIIVKFKERPSCDSLFASKCNLKKKALKILDLAMRTQYL